MIHAPGEHVRHRLEAAVRMIRSSFRFAGSELRRTHFVEEEKRIEVVERRSGERTVNQEATAFALGNALDYGLDFANLLMHRTILVPRHTLRKGFQNDARHVPLLSRGQ